MTISNSRTQRRRLLTGLASGAALASLGAPALVRAQAGPKLRIGYWS